MGRGVEDWGVECWCESFVRGLVTSPFAVLDLREAAIDKPGGSVVTLVYIILVLLSLLLSTIEIGVQSGRTSLLDSPIFVVRVSLVSSIACGVWTGEALWAGRTNFRRYPPPE